MSFVHFMLPFILLMVVQENEPTRAVSTKKVGITVCQLHVCVSLNDSYMEFCFLKFSTGSDFYVTSNPSVSYLFIISKSQNNGKF